MQHRSAEMAIPIFLKSDEFDVLIIFFSHICLQKIYELKQFHLKYICGTRLKLLNSNNRIVWLLLGLELKQRIVFRDKVFNRCW